MNNSRRVLQGIWGCINKESLVSKTIAELTNKKVVKVPKVKKRKQRKERKSIRSYRTYMKSKLWVSRKNKYWSTHGKRCGACDSTKYVTLHHKYYSNLYGYEPDSEVTPLCGRCHKLFHQNNKLAKDMVEATDEFVAEMQSAKALIKYNLELELSPSWRCL